MRPCLLTIVPPVLLGMFVATILIRKARMNLPPSPPGLPIIGHLHLLGTRPVRSLSDLSRRYESLMFLRFGNVPVLVASSPAAARLISKMRSHISCSPTVPVVSFEREELLSAPPGLYFKFHHRLRTAELFSAKPFHFFQPIINDEIRTLLQVVADNAACVHIRKELYDATFSIISRIAISRRAKDLRSPSQNDHSSSLQNLLIDSINLLGVQNIGDYKPCLAWMDLQGAKRAKAISTKIKSMWQQIIDDRRRTRLTRGSEIKDSDFLDVLPDCFGEGRPRIKLISVTCTCILWILSELDCPISRIMIRRRSKRCTSLPHSMEVPKKKSALCSERSSHRCLRAHHHQDTDNMFDACIDSSTLTVEWAIAELLAHPRILQKAQQELEEVVGAIRLVQESDIVRLPYLRAIIKETMRLHPIAPLFMPHTVSESCRICGYNIPRSTVACINVWAMGRDSKVWKDPLRFCPERLLDSNMEVRGQDFELLPFGSASLACPGLAFGLNNVHLMLSNLLNAFEWRRIGEIDLSEKVGTLMSLKSHLVAKATLKIPRCVIDGNQSA
ncbi:hypothetical protein KP509_19G067500 [Ceratopteris richardii]|uniref:Cytochrome P450 n=1 Tax=Ceratopteris richardii TaxID=49495 RepID=A0A8T2SL13_CERRI|nr:hypothetical protein KP509_19G067500 [Ceratopteris richardii]